MNHSWQQPIRPLQYQLLSTEYKDRWSWVLFIRPTNDSWQIMGEAGCVWGPDSVMLRWIEA